MSHAPFELPPEFMRELHRPRPSNGRRAAGFILMYLFAAMALSAIALSGPRSHWVYFACAPLYLLAAASLHGISLFTHEAVHGTLSANRRRNAVLGAVCAWPVLQNFSAYRVLHLRHHDHLGEEGDPDHYDNYTRWSWLVFAMHWGRLLLGYPAYIIAIPILGFRHGSRRDRFWIVVEVLCVVAMVTAAIVSPIPRPILIHAWLIPMVFINTLVNIRGMSQHTLLEEANDDIRGTRSILTSRVVAFFMCNENYHLEHHLYPGVPWYNLPALHRATKDELTRRGAPYIRSYFSFVREFVIGSFRRRSDGVRPMSDTGWVDEALRMPIAFAQVREDPRVDLAVVERLRRSDLSGLMIASGGCTAAALVASGRFASLQLVDANAAQLALTGLKLGFLRHASPARRGELLGHTPYAARAADLASLYARLTVSPDVFGPPQVVARLGPDHAGRYELLFARLRQVMVAKGLSDWPSMLTTPGAANAVAPGLPLGRVFDEAFDEVMALDKLVALFGQAATQNGVEPFARHFAGRTRHAMTSLPTRDNPFLWQLLVGRFPPDRAYDWLPLPAPTRPPEVTSTHARMGDVLASTAERRLDFIHLSNVLDWLTEAEATEMLRLAHRALKPGGLTIIRQLNSSLDLPALGPQFEWLAEEADALHRRDRSFFYRRLHLGRRP